MLRGRTKRELATMVVFSVATFAFAAMLVVVAPVLFVLRALDRGATPAGYAWGALAAVWIAVILQAVIRDRETRGWIFFLLLFWTVPLASLARRVALAVRR